MRFLLAVAAFVALPGPLAGQQPHTWQEDIVAIERFLAADQSFSTDEMTVAQERLRALRQNAAGMSRASFALAAAEIARAADNAHTMILPGAWAQLFNRLPVRLLATGEGLYIGCAAAPYAHLIGAEVLSIEGRRWNELQDAYARYESGSPGLRRRFIVHFLESPELLHAAGLSRWGDRVRLRVRSADGRRRQVTLEASSAAPRFEGLEAYLPPDPLVDLARGDCAPWSQTPLYLQDAANDYRFADIPEIDAAYIQLKFNAGDELPEFLVATQAALRERERRALVLDLRFLIGGDLSVTRQFFNELPSMIASEGRIYIITSGGTLSAGIAAVGFVKQAAGNRAIIVGEPMGEGLEYWAETDSIDLPNAGATLLYATLKHNYRTGCPEPECYRYMQGVLRLESLDPDIVTPLRFGDVLAGRDPAMDAIMARERSGAS